MALPSQAPRQSSSRIYVGSGRKWINKRWVVLGLIDLSVLAVIVLVGRELLKDAPTKPIAATEVSRTANVSQGSEPLSAVSVVEIAPQPAPIAPIQEPVPAPVPAPAPAPVPAPVPAPAPASVAPSHSGLTVEQALALKSTNPVRCRTELSRLLTTPLTAADLGRALQGIRDVNAVLVFSNRVVPGDQFSTHYTVQSGDSLSKIARKTGMQADWRLIKRVNGLKNDSAIYAGQKLKIPLGCFHADVSKSQYRLYLFLGEGEHRVLVASMPVGLGSSDSTPTGTFIVRPKSKLIDPEWKHPHTGEYFAANDPLNPIGDHWIGLMGVDPHNAGTKGYGIHGTVEPDSIGQQRSLGCVRMNADEVAVVYEALTEPNSTVMIRP